MPLCRKRKYTNLENFFEKTSCCGLVACQCPLAMTGTALKDWSKCAAFAVIEGARKGDAEAQAEVVNRLEMVAGAVKTEKVFILITNDGHWARGESVEQAAKLLKKLGSSKAIVYGFVVINDSKPIVDGSGFLVTNAEAININLGKLGSLAGLVK